MSKKQVYKIRMLDGTIGQVEGEVFNRIWGIDKRTVVYSKRRTKDGVESPLAYTNYVITHLPTGTMLNLGQTRTLKSAKLLLSEPEFFYDGRLTPEIIKGMSQAVWRFWNKLGWKD